MIFSAEPFFLRGELGPIVSERLTSFQGSQGSPYSMVAPPFPFLQNQDMMTIMKPNKHRRFALVREIPDAFDQCIKPLESPQTIDLELARAQHRRYCEALSQLGFELIVLPADDRYPDCTFVEDTAVVFGDRAIITRPGAESRRGEVDAVCEALSPYKCIDRILPPGSLEGGDVLLAEDRVFVGLTERTNQDGIHQLERLLRGSQLRVVSVPIGRSLHLKTACNYLGKGLMVVRFFDFNPEVLTDFDIIRPDPSEVSRLSFLPVNGSVLLPDDCPKAREEFANRGWKTIPLGLSEIRKAQAGLTCMSILFQV
jgi:dimethylargininase